MPLTTYTAGEVLTAASLNSNFSYVESAGGLVLVKSVTVGSSVSSVEVTAAFSSTYDNYFVTYTGGQTGSATATGVLLTLGATTTGYYGSFQYVSFAGAESNLTDNNAARFSYAGVVAIDSSSVAFSLFGPNLARRTLINIPFMGNTTGDGSGYYGGFLNNSTQYTAFTLTFPTINVSGGTVRVYGYKNS